MPDDRMSITEHLSDLRKRIVVSLIALLAAFLVSFNFSEWLFGMLTVPLKNKVVFIQQYPFFCFVPNNQNLSLVFLAPAEAFWMHLKVSMITGLVLSLPVIFHQLWQFIAPGLLQKEKKYAAPFIIVTTLLFGVGAFFCFVFVLPFAMGFLLTYKTASLTPMLSVGNYIDFCLKFILAFGLIFELPVIIVFVTRIGLVSPDMLAKNRKYAILTAFLISAVLTPTPDAFNQVLMAVPMIFLYEIGIIIARVTGSGRRRNA